MSFFGQKFSFFHFSQKVLLGSARYRIFRQILSISTTFLLTPSAGKLIQTLKNEIFWIQLYFPPHFQGKQQNYHISCHWISQIFGTKLEGYKGLKITQPDFARKIPKKFYKHFFIKIFSFLAFSQFFQIRSVPYRIFRWIITISTTFVLTPCPSGVPKKIYKQFQVKFRSNQANFHKLTYFRKG